MSHWIHEHITEPIDRLYDKVDQNLALDSATTDEILQTPQTARSKS